MRLHNRTTCPIGVDWPRLIETFGTFLLVLVGAGAPAVDQSSHGQIGRVAAVIAPALTVLAIILFMGAVSGAHLNPVVSVAFALRGDFGWRRVPGYVVAQLLGALLAALFLRITFGDLAHVGATLRGAGFTTTQAFALEAVLSLGLVAPSSVLPPAPRISGHCPPSASPPTSPWPAYGQAQLAARP